MSEIDSQFKISFRLLCQKQVDDLNYVMLNYFRVLEILSDYYIKSSNYGDDSLIYKTGEVVKYCKFNSKDKNYTLEKNYDRRDAYFSTSNKIMAIMCEKLNFDLRRQLPDFRNVFLLSKKRNDFIHPKNRASYISPNAEEIVRWTKTLKQILMKLS